MRAQVIRTPRLSIRWSAELLWALSIHRVNTRYKETLFGFGWILLQPIALTIIFAYIRRVANIPSGEVPYPLFSATGLCAWALTSLVVSQSLVCISGFTPVIKRVAVPKILFPLSVIVASMVDLCVMVLFLIALLFYYGTAISVTILWLPVLLFVHLCFLFALTCLTSLANVYMRDISHALPSLLQLWFFASPVFYPSSMVPEEFRALSHWNPLTGLIEGYRSVLLLHQSPSLQLLAHTAIITFILLGIGLPIFVRLESCVADAL